MALKLADTAKPMGDFPVAEATDIDITTLSGQKKSLQQMYTDGELGGGNGALVMTSAEWEALDPKPEDGTQIVISDDLGNTYIRNISQTNIDGVEFYAGSFAWGGSNPLDKKPLFSSDIYETLPQVGKLTSFDGGTSVRYSLACQIMEAGKGMVERFTRTREHGFGEYSWTPWFGSMQIYTGEVKNIGMYRATATSTPKPVLKYLIKLDTVIDAVSGWVTISDVSELSIERILDLKVYDENGNIVTFNKCKVEDGNLRVYMGFSTKISEVAFEYLHS